MAQAGGSLIKELCFGPGWIPGVMATHPLINLKALSQWSFGSTPPGFVIPIMCLTINPHGLVQSLLPCHLAGSISSNFPLKLT